LIEANGRAQHFDELDHALEWCENSLLRAAGRRAGRDRVEGTEHELFHGLPRSALAPILMLLEPRQHRAGELIVARGAPADEFFLVMAGRSTVNASGAPGRRLATISAGMTFGELGFALRGTRTADVVAETQVDLLVLDRHSFEFLRDEHPPVSASLLERLLESLAQPTLRLDLEARAIAQ